MVEEHLMKLWISKPLDTRLQGPRVDVGLGCIKEELSDSLKIRFYVVNRHGGR